MTPEYIEELADIADPEKLWRFNGLEQRTLPPEKQRQLDAGVALRRYASHVRDVQSLLGTGRSLVITPLATNSTAIKAIPAPGSHKRLLAERQRRT